MSQPEHRLHPKIRAALDETGLLWSVQPGRKHMKLFLAGRFIAALPRVPDDSPYCASNTIASIRREARSIQGGQRE